MFLKQYTFTELESLKQSEAEASYLESVAEKIEKTGEIETITETKAITPDSAMQVKYIDTSTDDVIVSIDNGTVQGIRILFVVIAGGGTLTITGAGLNISTMLSVEIIWTGTIWIALSIGDADGSSDLSALEGRVSTLETGSPDSVDYLNYSAVWTSLSPSSNLTIIYADTTDDDVTVFLNGGSSSGQRVILLNKTGLNSIHMEDASPLATSSVSIMCIWDEVNWNVLAIGDAEGSTADLTAVEGRLDDYDALTLDTRVTENYDDIQTLQSSGIVAPTVDNYNHLGTPYILAPLVAKTIINVDTATTDVTVNVSAGATDHDSIQFLMTAGTGTLTIASAGVNMTTKVSIHMVWGGTAWILISTGDEIPAPDFTDVEGRLDNLEGGFTYPLAVSGVFNPAEIRSIVNVTATTDLTCTLGNGNNAGDSVQFVIVSGTGILTIAGTGGFSETTIVSLEVFWDGTIWVVVSRGDEGVADLTEVETRLDVLEGSSPFAIDTTGQTVTPVTSRTLINVTMIEDMELTIGNGLAVGDTAQIIVISGSTSGELKVQSLGTFWTMTETAVELVWTGTDWLCINRGEEYPVLETYQFSATPAGPLVTGPPKIVVFVDTTSGDVELDIGNGHDPADFIIFLVTAGSNNLIITGLGLTAITTQESAEIAWTGTAWVQTALGDLDLSGIATNATAIGNLVWDTQSISATGTVTLTDPKTIVNVTATTDLTATLSNGATAGDRVQLVIVSGSSTLTVAGAVGFSETTDVSMEVLWDGTTWIVISRGDEPVAGGSGGGWTRQIHDTGWINRTDWTGVTGSYIYGDDNTLNTDSDINHGWGCGIHEIETRLLLSQNGTDALAIETKPLTGYNTNTGWSVHYVDTNNLRIVGGSSGLVYMMSNGAAQVLVDQFSDFYYRVICYKWTAPA